MQTLRELVLAPLMGPQSNSGNVIEYLATLRKDTHPRWYLAELLAENAVKAAYQDPPDMDTLVKFIWLVDADPGRFGSGLHVFTCNLINHFRGKIAQTPGDDVLRMQMGGIVAFTNTSAEIVPRMPEDEFGATFCRTQYSHWMKIIDADPEFERPMRCASWVVKWKAHPRQVPIWLKWKCGTIEVPDVDVDCCEKLLTLCSAMDATLAILTGTKKVAVRDRSDWP